MRSIAFLIIAILYSSSGFAGFSLNDLKDAVNKIDEAVKPTNASDKQNSGNNESPGSDIAQTLAGNTSNKTNFCIDDNVCLGNNLNNLKVKWVDSDGLKQQSGSINERKLSYTMSVFPYQTSDKYVGLYSIFSDELHNPKIYLNKKNTNEIGSLSPVCRFVTAEGSYIDEKGSKITVRFNPLTKDYIKYDWVVTAIEAEFVAKTEAGKNTIIQKYEGMFGEILEPMEIDSGRATMIHQGETEPVGYGIASKQKNRESVTIRLGDSAGFGEPYWNGLKRLPSFNSYELDEGFMDSYKLSSSCKKPDENAEQTYMKAMSTLGK